VARASVPVRHIAAVVVGLVAMCAAHESAPRKVARFAIAAAPAGVAAIPIEPASD